MEDNTDYSGRLAGIERILAVRAVLAIITAEAVMILWNLLLPALIHIHPISYWQALGLLVLTRLLTGRGGGPVWRGRSGRYDQWINMTKEERSACREQWQQRKV